MYRSPWGDVPGSVMVQHVVNELLLQGWDLARATGQPTDLARDLAEESLVIWRAWIGGLRDDCPVYWTQLSASSLTRPSVRRRMNPLKGPTRRQ